MSDHSVNLQFELQHIVIAVKDAISKWYDLGLQLGLPDATLTEIRLDPDTGSHLRMMLSKWLSYDPKASWEKLANALTRIGMNTIAANIRVKYMKAATTTTITTTTATVTTAVAATTSTTTAPVEVSNDDQTCMHQNCYS
jgi:hypothetical protein